MERAIELGFNPKKVALLAGGIILALILVFGCFGINDAGYNTVIQYPWGEMSVKTTPGVYSQWFGKTTMYKKESTYSFLHPTKEDQTSKQAETPASSDEENDSVSTLALPVRYNDGGTGNIYGKARFRMPESEESILKIHNAFRSYDHLAEALYKPTTQNVMNLTAALMSSEESYTTAKEKFQRWAEDQMLKGPFETQLQIVKVEGQAGKTEEVQKAAIKFGSDGKAIHSKSPLADYLVQVTQLQIVTFTYEPNTLAQIQKKRTALMSIIQAKAEAEEAVQKKITAEAQGQKDVMVAKYEKEVEKERSIVNAQMEKEVAVISAKKVVEVNQQKLEAAKLDKAAAEQEKLAMVDRGKGEAEARRLKMEADGALEQKLKAITEINKNYAEALGKNKLVPDIMFGGRSDGKSQSSAQDLVDLLVTKTAKDLALELAISNKDAKK